jgi:type II secretory pathway pseudopilin PulG
MDVHPPSSPVHSIKDFAIHLAMIVLGILIAVTVEGWRESRHHEQLASEMRTRILAELSANRKQVAASVAAFKTSLKDLKALEELTARVARGEKLSAEAAATASAVSIDMRTPLLPGAAWEAALATQAVQYMSANEVARYAAIYSTQQYVMSIVLAHKSNQLLLAAAEDDVDINMTAEEARTVRQSLRYSIGVISSHLNNLANLEERYKALDVPG